MSFATWRKKSKVWQEIEYLFNTRRHVTMDEVHDVAQAAYLAGIREGRKQVELAAANAILLAQDLACKQTAKFTSTPRG